MLVTIKSLFSVAIVGLSLVLLSGCQSSNGKPFEPYRPAWVGQN